MPVDTNQQQGSDNKERIQRLIFDKLCQWSLLAPVQRHDSQRLLDSIYATFSRKNTPHSHFTDKSLTTWLRKFLLSNTETIVALLKVPRNLRETPALDYSIFYDFLDHYTWNDFRPTRVSYRSQPLIVETTNTHSELPHQLNSPTTNNEYYLSYKVAVNDENQIGVYRYDTTPGKSQDRASTNDEQLENLLDSFYYDKLVDANLAGTAESERLSQSLFFDKAVKSDKKSITPVTFRGIKLTRELIEEWISKDKRSKTQEQVTRISAARYAAQYGFKNTLETVHGPSAFNWCHFSAHRFGGLDGKDPQVIENLGCATTGFNSRHSMIEHLITWMLAKEIIKEAVLNIEVDYLKDTKMILVMRYQVCFNLNGQAKAVTFTLDGLLHGRPSIRDFHEMLSILGIKNKPSAIARRLLDEFPPKQELDHAATSSPPPLVPNVSDEINASFGDSESENHSSADVYPTSIKGSSPRLFDTTSRKRTVPDSTDEEHHVAKKPRNS